MQELHSHVDILRFFLSTRFFLSYMICQCNCSYQVWQIITLYKCLDARLEEYILFGIKFEKDQVQSPIEGH